MVLGILNRIDYIVFYIGGMFWLYVIDLIWTILSTSGTVGMLDIEYNKITCYVLYIHDIILVI